MESELLGPQFSSISIAFYFSLPNVMFYPRLIRAFFFLPLQTDIDLAISWAALLSTIRKMKLYIYDCCFHVTGFMHGMLMY